MTIRQYKDADDIPIADPKKPKSKKQIVLCIKKLSTGIRKDAKVFKHMKDKYMNNPTIIFQVKKLLKNTDPKKIYPSSSQLLRQKEFGNNNLFKFFKVIPNFANIAVILWEGFWLYIDQESKMADSLPERKKTVSKVQKYKVIDFTALQLLPLDHDNENFEVTRESKRILRDVCLIHFDMNLDLIQLYCRGRWLGEHRRTNQMLRTLSDILPDQIFIELCTNLVDGVPNLLNAELDNKEVQEMIHRGNLPNTKSNPNPMKKAIIKEEKNHLSMIFSKT